MLCAATREAAFVHAVTAAGLAYAVARSCREGQLAACSCSRSARPRNLPSGFLWGTTTDYEYPYMQLQLLYYSRRTVRVPHMEVMLNAKSEDLQ